MLQDLYSFLPHYAKTINLSIEEIKGEADHLHFLLSTRPTDTLSSVIGALKSKSSNYLLSKRYIFPYYGKHSRTVWSSSYFVCSTGGVNIDTLKKYISNQGTNKFR